jgi:hypothetical protein
VGNFAVLQFVVDEIRWVFAFLFLAFFFFFLFLHLVVLSGGPAGSALLYQAAERTVYDALSYILPAAARHADADPGAGAREHASGTVAGDGNNRIIALCRVFQYLVHVLDHTSGGGAGGSGRGADSSSSSSSSSVPKSDLRRNTSGGSGSGSGSQIRNINQQLAPFQPALNELTHEPETLHILFSLNALSFLLAGAGAGNADAVRTLVVR